MQNLEILWSKADSLKGCLSHLKTRKSYRRHQSEVSEPLHNDGDIFHLHNDFVGDEAKLLNSKAYRVLANKTQVFTHPVSPLIRTRQAHVQEVVGITVIACDMLGLNASLGRAAAIGTRGPGYACMGADVRRDQ